MWSHCCGRLRSSHDATPGAPEADQPARAFSHMAPAGYFCSWIRILGCPAGPGAAGYLCRLLGFLLPFTCARYFHLHFRMFPGPSASLSSKRRANDMFGAREGRGGMVPEAPPRLLSCHHSLTLSLTRWIVLLNSHKWKCANERHSYVYVLICGLLLAQHRRCGRRLRYRSCAIRSA